MKKKVAIIFGGRSAEHEVSLNSAKNIYKALDQNLFEAVLIAISKQGSWYALDQFSTLEKLKAIDDSDCPPQLEPASIICEQSKSYSLKIKSSEKTPLDVAFPILHGTYGEDGTIQGLFKMMSLPFVGCDVLASSVGMDKEFMKRLLQQAGLPTPQFHCIHKGSKVDFSELESLLGAPFFIKPANAGSSVGVHKIRTAQEFELKIQDAFLYDHKVLAEKFIEGREIECSVLGLNQKPKASLPGEVIPTHEFYSYEAKYLDENGAHLKIPAELSKEQREHVQHLAEQTYKTLGCDGLARVDFFLSPSGQVFINEINTMPGFTKISMYPKMWEASGIKYSELITRLIDLAFQKQQLDQSLSTNFK